MANSELDLFEVQVGEQVDFDTVIAPTAKLMGVETFEITPIVESEHIPEMRGDLTPAYQSVVNRSNAEWSLEGTALFEDLPYILDNLLGEAAPTGTGPYERVYVGAGAKPVPKILTMVKGSEEGVYGIVGGLATSLELSFEANQKVTYTAGGFGKQLLEDTLTTLADRTTGIIHGNQLAIAIDGFGNAAGTTPYPGVKFSGTLSIDIARAIKEGLGSLNPVGWKQPKSDPGSNQLTVSLEFDQTSGYSKDFFDELIAVTHTPFQKVIQLLFTLDANNSLGIDFAGFSEAAPTLFTDSDGIATLEFVLSAHYEATLANWLKITSENGVAVLP